MPDNLSVTVTLNAGVWNVQTRQDGKIVADRNFPTKPEAERFAEAERRRLGLR